MTNYDIHMNEISNVHQRHLNNKKYHTLGLKADLLKVKNSSWKIRRVSLSLIERKNIEKFSKKISKGKKIEWQKCRKKKKMPKIETSKKNCRNVK